MKSQVLHTVWCNIPGEAAEEIRNWSPLGSEKSEKRMINFTEISPSASPEMLHSMMNLTFHNLLRWKMIILTTLTNSLIHFSSEGWENARIEP